METKKELNVYLEALKITFMEVERRDSLKALALLFGKKHFGRGIRTRFYGTLVNYIRFCRAKYMPVCLTGREL